jgi:2-iminobutanoate/2-iminopropanoate deaminase
MRSIIETDKSPAAIGPYSQAVRAGDLLFVSGQIPIDPATGSIVEGGIAEQTDRVLQNIAGILDAAGAGLDDLVKTTIFLADMDDFAEVNRVYAGYFRTEPPARSTVQVARLPKDVRVEIESVAFMGICSLPVADRHPSG